MIDHAQARGCFSAQGHGRGHGYGRRHGGADCARTAPLDVGKPLTGEAEAAVLTALDDEYHARAFYRAVIRRFGEVRPFVNIEQSESRHIAALKRVLKAYGVRAPADPHDGSPAIESIVPATVAAACAVAAQAEIDNDRLYEERLLPHVRDYPGVRTVFERLSEASRERHLPAFRRGAAAH